MLRREFLKLCMMASGATLLPKPGPLQSSTGLPPKRLRGLMIDAARLPEKPAYYRRFLDFCHDWHINAVLFRLTDDQGSALRFAKHPELVTHEHALTPAEARDLAAYAAGRGITLIPEIETFGHTSYITATPPWAHLADTPRDKPSEFVGICPVHPQTRKLMADLVSEVAEIFPSAYLHAGCDEVNWGGSELSRQALKQHSRAEIWADYLNWLNGLCTRSGKQMIVWGDFVAHKEPAILERLAKSVIVMDWQYYVTDAQVLADTARKVAGCGLRVIGAPALTSCEWGPRPGARTLENVDAYVDAYSIADSRCMGVIVTNWVPSRYMANALWDCFAYAASSMSLGAKTARQTAIKKFVQDFYGAKWDADWEHAIGEMYESAPGRTCTRAWHPPRLPLPSVADEEVKAAASARPLAPGPYAALAEKIRGLAPKVLRNKTEFAAFSLTADYIAHIVWREAQWPALRSATAEAVSKLMAEISSRDAAIASRVQAEWSVARFELDRFKHEPLPYFTPYDQLLMRMQQAADYSAELSQNPKSLRRLLDLVRAAQPEPEKE